MNQPFFAAANRVIRMYTMRQERASAKVPAHSPAEISWACNSLNNIALAAAYAAHCDEYTEITKLAEQWPAGQVPALFSEESQS